jgi:hypothetical protein
LARRFSHHYLSQRQLIEVSGKDGQPLFPAGENQFNVVLELHPPEQTGVEKPPASEAFRIVQPNGTVDLWQPQQPNRERPPLS